MVEDYFRQYGLIAVFVLVAVSLPVMLLMVSRMGALAGIRPTRRAPPPEQREPSVEEFTPEGIARASQVVRLATYESGMKVIGPRWTRFNFRYYYFALLFVVFDVETIFLYPWAVSHGPLSKEFGAIVLVEVLVFLAVVTLGYVYAWRKRALEWL